MEIQPVQPKIINAPQALFGTLLGVWYGNLTRDVLNSTELNPIVQTLVSIVIVKFFFIFASLIFLCFFVNYLITFQNYTYSFPNLFINGTTFKKTWQHSKSLLWNLGLIMISIWGLLLVTYFLFTPEINPYFLAFGAIQPLVWILLEVWLIWSPLLSEG